MFPAWHIALTSLITAVLTAALAGVTIALGRSKSTTPVSGQRTSQVLDVLVIGLAAGLGVLLWRLGANIPTLNDDPIPGVSPADVLSGPVAFVAVGVYTDLRGGAERWASAQALAALVALIVNIVTI
jgi:hypothetical protein